MTGQFAESRLRIAIISELFVSTARQINSCFIFVPNVYRENARVPRLNAIRKFRYLARHSSTPLMINNEMKFVEYA